MSFVDVLLSGSLGQIAACNIVDSLDLVLLSPTAVKKVLRVAKKRARSATTSPHDDSVAVGALARAARDTGSHYRVRRLPLSLRPTSARPSRRFKTVVARWLLVKNFKSSILNKNLIYTYRGHPYKDADLIVSRGVV